MKSKYGAGILAGVIAGIVFGIIELFFQATLANGIVVPDLNLVGRFMNATDMGSSWLWQIIGTGILGAIFAGLLSNRTETTKSAVGWGVVFGLVWWVISGLIAVPAALRIPVGAVALPGLIGWVIFGLILGPVFKALYRPSARLKEAAREMGERVGTR